MINGMDMSAMSRKLRSASYVSFDIFDTLIRRRVEHPKDVFSLMATYALKHGLKMDADFREKRCAAERTAVQRKNGPCTAEEIYGIYAEQFGGEAEEYLALEKKMQKLVCCPDADMVALFNECVRMGKHVLIISDMYLDSGFLTDLLDHCGVRGFEKLYVSCEHAASKADGELFHIVLKDKNIKPQQLLHIGDNRKSDVFVPMRMGMKTMYINRQGEYKPSRPQKIMGSVTGGVMERSAWLCQTRQKNRDQSGTTCVKDEVKLIHDAKLLGIQTFGPLLSGLSSWLADECRKEGISQIFFLARDGYMMQRAFKCIYPEEFQTHYLYASRRSWTVPLIWKHPDYLEVLDRITLLPKGPVRVILIRLGLDPETCQSAVKACGLELDTVIDRSTLRDSKPMRTLYEMLLPRIIENSKAEYEAVLQYMATISLKEKIAVVDIGYSGTMQYGMQELFKEAGIQSQLYGYYMGVNKKGALVENGTIRAKGFLYGPGMDNDYQSCFDAFRPISEAIFLTQQGSLEKFRLRDGQVEFVLYPYEYDSDEKKRVDEVKIIQSYQAGAIEYVQDLAKVLASGALNIDPDSAGWALVDMGLRPTKQVLDVFGDIRVSDTDVFLIVDAKPLGYYVRHLKALKKDFAKSSWKIAFMKKVLRIPLPYDRLYYWMKGHLK